MRTPDIANTKNLVFTDEKTTDQTVTYRKDIDGLRGIAVLSVVLYHISGAWLPGGFVGVDVFFVISGYLISKYIYTHLEQGTFSLKKFFTHRIRRILPTFIFFLCIVSIVGFFILTPPDLKSLSLTSLSAILSVSNLYFWKFISIGYFETDASILPLLHTWSLGIEEQFYLIWPILLSWLFTKAHRNNKTEWLGPVVIMSGLMSFFLYYCLKSHPIMVFYMPITRAFELLLGSSLAIYANKLKKLTPIKASMLSLAGLVFIIYPMIFFSQNDYPSSFILLPCLGSLLLIHAGSTQNITRQILSSRSITFFGLISYSFYLWHWPIIAYINYLGIAIDLKVGALIFTAAMTLAVFSWQYIEQPFRKKYLFNFSQSLLLFFALPLTAISIFIYICYSVPNFGFNKTSPRILNIINDYEGPYSNKNCIDAPTLHPSSDKTCSLGDLSHKKPEVLVVGDSHAMAFAGFIHIFLNHAHLKGYLLTQSGTPFILGKINDWRDNLPMQRNHLILDMIRKNHYKYVILGGFWDYYPDAALEKKPNHRNPSYEKFNQGLEHAIKMIIMENSIPVVIMDVPPLLNIPTQCSFSRIGLSHCANPVDKISAIQQTTRSLLFRMQKKYPKTILIDPNTILCNNDECTSYLKDTPLYHTGLTNSHLNYAGSTLIGQLYLEKWGNPLS